MPVILVPSRAGRPHVSSRATLAEAACELFLERGFERTSIAEIASRAGVSRSSFFNYFASKAAIFWDGLDERIVRLERELDFGAEDADAAVHAAVLAIGDDFVPDALALAIVHADAMGLADELDREAGVRRARIARAVAHRLRAAGAPALHAEVVAAAWGGAVLAAIEAWARGGAGREPLGELLARAARSASALPLGGGPA